MTERIPGKEDVGVGGLPPKGIPETPEELPSGKDFSKVMEQMSSPQKAGEAAGPMQLKLGAMEQGHAVSAHSLNESLNTLKQASTDLHDQLTDQRFKGLSDAQKSLLSTKLSQFNKSVQGLSKQVGIDYKAPEEAPPGPSQLKTFLSWITGGQHQIATVQDHLSLMGSKMSPTDMMRAQAQMLAASRAINFATAVVGQGSNFIKTIMQTQI
ncbi:MAG: hypothetical protein JSR80_00745 [Verrucomicrobia bacterium]|nr:hypothetical protein [Verrucomicrobiota bacterium]